MIYFPTTNVRRSADNDAVQSVQDVYTCTNSHCGCSLFARVRKCRSECPREKQMVKSSTCFSAGFDSSTNFGLMRTYEMNSVSRFRFCGFPETVCSNV